MDITITLPLEDGELEAYQAEVAAYNALNGTSLTPGEYGAAKLTADAKAGKAAAIKARADRMTATAQLLPDDARARLTDTIQADITAEIAAHVASLSDDERVAFLARVNAINA